MKIKYIAVNLTQKKALVKVSAFALFLIIAILAPLLKQQLVTGSIVNAVLFISTAYLGITAGILISFIPSLFAGFSGLLPIPLLPMIPYIIMGNIILVLCFGLLRKKNFLLSAISASLLKFLFLFATSSFIINFFIQKALPAKIITMMAWPQLITALSGSLIAFIVLRKYKMK